VTLKGRAASAPVFSLPEKEDPTEGTPFSSVSALDPNARVVAVVAVSPEVAKRAADADAANKDGAANGNGDAPALAGAYILLGTANGMVKKTSAGELPGASSQVFSIINVAEDDAVVGARLTNGTDEILLITALGRAIRFKEEEVRAMGLVAGGVMGIKPGERDDKVVGIEVAQPKAEVFMITDLGMGKRTPMKEYPTQGRYGVGVTAATLAGKQRIAGFVVGQPTDRLTVLTSKGGGKALKLDAAGRRGRATRGSTIVKLKAGETVTGVVPVLEQFSLPEIEVVEAKPAKATKAAKSASNGKAAKNGKAPAKKAAKKASPSKNGKKPAKRK
jgi:DNA gyrase subunit A